MRYLLVCWCLCLAACAVGMTHTVKPGENLYRIGQAYGIDYRRLGRVNRVFSPYKIKAGDRLFVPGRNRQLPVRIITPRTADPARPKALSAAGNSARAFVWPVRGRISSKFGPRDKSHHDGIDIAVVRNTPIMVAMDGKVIYSDRLSGYGNVVIVEHKGGYTTVYAHNDRNLVSKGQRLLQGQKLALAGDTGKASAPHLHFEVRKDNIARNPIYYLPPL